jgi:hypothetical protein
MKLLTAQQVATEFNLPTARTVRTMVAKGLPVVRLGRTDLFDAADVEAFIAARKESRCHAPTPAPALNGSSGGSRSMSSGTSAVQNASALQARQIAASLKRSSRHSSGKRTEDQQARVILGKF